MKAAPANGQSCLPGSVITAQSMPLARPSPHSDLAAASWLPASAAVAPPLTANHPDTPVYRPRLVITVAGSNAAQASVLPPNSHAMVCARVPVFGPRSPAMSTNALNRSGCIAVRSTAQVPPIDQPATPQCDGSGLTPKFEIR